MALIIGKGSKAFIWNNLLEVDSSGSTMEDCQIRLNNTFTKLLPKREIAVFGDYTVYILCGSAKKEGKAKYYTKSIRTAFYDIIPYRIVPHGHKPVDRSDIKIDAEFLFQPSCKYNFETALRGGFICSYWKVQHNGEININLSVDEVNEEPEDAGDSEDAKTDDTFDKAESIDYNTDSELSADTKVWRINQNLNIQAADLLEMDTIHLDRVSETNHPFTTIIE